MKYFKDILMAISEWTFPLKKSLKKYHINNSKNYESYINNLKSNQWDNFEKIFYEVYKVGCFHEHFNTQKTDLKKEFDSAIAGQSPFVSKIDGLSLKGISVESHFGEGAAKGVMKLSYSKENGPSASNFTVTPASINYFQTPTGGLIISLSQQQVEGLLRNTPENIIFKHFRRLDEVTHFDILQSLKFFLLCSEERALWGKITFIGRIKYRWIVSYRSKIIEMLLTHLEKMLLSTTSKKLNK